MTALILTVCLMLGLSFFCSVSEAALYAVSPVRVEALRVRGRSHDLKLFDLRANIARPITAILFLNTFANTMGAAIAGSIFGERFTPAMMLPFSIALTVAVLVLAEIIPKSLGVGYARHLAPILAWPIQLLVWSFYPLVRAGEVLTNTLKPKQGEVGPSEDDIVTLAHMGAEGGAIMHMEAKWVKGVLELDKLTARDIMTPRPVLVTLVGNQTIGDLGAELARLDFSRLPVTTEEGPDHIRGIVLRRDLANAFLQGEHDKRVSDLQFKPKFVPESMRGHQLLRVFIQEKTHLVVVVDEYGGTMGVVTLEDVIEAMIGEEIVDEFDAHTDLREFARRRAAAKLEEEDNE
ncbi:MAG: hemolysin family protein [Candidatus Lernaella stagnicola]|nr:hemolysin family protein [Candidatus Lernaella stagnicola]